jgi:pilus assembly protein Flp/PilA
MSAPLGLFAVLFLRAKEFARTRLAERENGQGMVEYALILVLIAIVVIVILQIVGKQVNNVFSNISNGLSK